MATDETIGDLLAAGTGADLVVLPLAGGAPAAAADSRMWSTTPVLAILQRGPSRGEPADEVAAEVAERVEEAIP